MSIPDQMSEWAIARLPGESDTSMRERIRRDGMPLFCVAEPWRNIETPWSGVADLIAERGKIEDAIDILYRAKEAGYFGPYLDPSLSNLANASRCASAARDLIDVKGMDVVVLNYTDGFRIEVRIKEGGST